MVEKLDKSALLKTLENAKGGTFLPRDGSARAYKSQGLASVLPKVTRKVAGKRPTLISDLQASWAEVAGAQFAPMSRPIRLAGRVLTLEVAMGAGPIIAMAQDTILATVRLHLGKGKVDRLKIVQAEFPIPGAAQVSKIDQISVSRSNAPLTDAEKLPSSPSTVAQALNKLKRALDAGEDKD